MRTLEPRKVANPKLCKSIFKTENESIAGIKDKSINSIGFIKDPKNSIFSGRPLPQENAAIDNAIIEGPIAFEKVLVTHGNIRS